MALLYSLGFLVLLSVHSIAASPLNTMTNVSSYGSKSVPTGAFCANYTVPVTVTSLNYNWTAPKWTDNYGWIDFASTLTSRTDDGFPPPIGAPVTETASYQIRATFCTPVVPGNNSGKVLLATHGLGFDRSYWNPQYKSDDYNFVQYATQRGYSTFFYDRLGVGESSKVSGFHNQLNIQVSVLSALITNVRTKWLQYTLLDSAPASIILVGHSFGSFIGNSLLAANANIADACIMTGYGLKGYDFRVVTQGFAPRVANLQCPKFSTYDPGYITTGDIFGNINNFFKAPAYTHDVAQYAEDTKAPFAVSELVSLSPPLMNLDASDYKGPALVVSGEYDFIVCGGYCVGTLEPSFAGLFKGAKDFETYVQPGSGHSLNFAVNATGAFGVMFDYLARNGL